MFKGLFISASPAVGVGDPIQPRINSDIKIMGSKNGTCCNVYMTQRICNVDLGFDLNIMSTALSNGRMSPSWGNVWEHIRSLHYFSVSAVHLGCFSLCLSRRHATLQMKPNLLIDFSAFMAECALVILDIIAERGELAPAHRARHPIGKLVSPAYPFPIHYSERRRWIYLVF